jgi:hypothetical protein
MAPSKRRKTSGSAGKPDVRITEQRPLPVTVLSGFLVIYFKRPRDKSY